MSFNHVPVELPEIKATTKDKVRLYETPDGNFYPSITTVLSVRNKKGLLNGEKESVMMLQTMLQERLQLVELMFIICVKIT